MSYTPTIWQTGDTITEDKLNKIEQGILANSDYDNIGDKPSINGVELSGDKSTAELGIDVVPLAQNLVASSGTTDTTPYTLRSAPSYAGSVAELRKIVGGTLDWWVYPNNAASEGTTNGVTRTHLDGAWWHIEGTATAEHSISTTAAFAVQANHVYAEKMVWRNLASGTTIPTFFHSVVSSSALSTIIGNTKVVIEKATEDKTGVTIRPRAGNGYTYNCDVAVTVFDLTTMFGATIADAILAMESTPGNGWLWLNQYFPLDVYPRTGNVHTLTSVKATARQALDGNGNVIRSYPLDSDLTLRGIPKLTNGRLSYDGDIYLPSGLVTRRYGIVDLGTLTWIKDSGYNYFRAVITGGKNPASGGTADAICSNYVTYTGSLSAFNTSDKMCYVFASNIASTPQVAVIDSAHASDTTAQFKTAMSGVYLVYPLQTPTTETADPYAEIQMAGETEQFVCDNYIPVGNESFYPTDLTGVVQNLAPLPTAAGTYKLQVTVNNGVPSYSWVSG